MTAAPDFPLSVRVPGSTSNLGPGFDFLGLAIELFLEVTVTGRASGPAHEFESLTGTAADWPTGPNNLLLRALDRTLGRSSDRSAPGESNHPAKDVAAHGKGETPPPFLRLQVNSEIPMARGFGSSGAATVAGLLLGSALSGRELSEPDGIALGAELEHHPDNSTASLLGGCTLAVPNARSPHGKGTAPRAAEEHIPWRVLHPSIHPSIGLAIAWPKGPLPTAEGRRALPAQVPFEDAVENPRRAAALLEGLRTGDGDWLALGGEDRLHVAYRLPLIPGGAEALAAARDAGAWMATISGSGSGLIALAPHDACATVAEAMAAELRRVQGEATGRVVRPALEAPRVQGA